MKSFVFFVTFLLLAMVNSVEANNTLDKFFQVTQSMQADFIQIIKNTHGQLLEQSEGRLILSRPDKFILEYKTPSEQKYISNGQTLWMYDVELEQVTIKVFDDSIGDSPALLLSSNTNVYKHYRVDDIKPYKSDKNQWVQLLANKEDMTFERVLLAFDGSILKQMVMFDSFGQVTELQFSHIQVNKPFSLRQFTFTAPEGVDVIGAAQGEGSNRAQ